MIHSRLASLTSERRWTVAAPLFGLMLAIAVPAQAQFSIDTRGAWNGTSFISSFGVPNTATYGQTITVAAGASPLINFSFAIGCDVATVYRADIFAWNGTIATGVPLFESAPATIPGSGVNNFGTVTINVGGLSLAPGQYVLALTTSQDQTGAPNSTCRWGALTTNALYTGGQFVFQNNTANFAQLTTVNWSFIAEDLVFTVTGLNGPPGASSVPATSTTSLLIGALGLTALGFLSLRRFRRQHT